MANPNKRKGRYFEEKIANDYRTLFKLDKIDCYRSGSSGARTTVEYNGDITFSNPERYNLITECKFYKDLRLEHIFPICNSYIDTWLEQSKSQYVRYLRYFNKEPLSLIIAGKPFNKNNHFVIWTNDSYLDNHKLLDKLKVKEYAFFTSSMHNRQYLVFSYSNITAIFNLYKLL